jgi:hypothetical protein
VQDMHKFVITLTVEKYWNFYYRISQK